MTTTGIRRSRAAAGVPLWLLPVAVILVLFGVVLLLAQVAPGRVTGGVYQVTVGQGVTQFVIAAESLSCARIGATARCTTPVGGRPLVIHIVYTGVSAFEPSSCTARHGDRSVSCESGMGDFGHVSHSVWISDGLGATDTELAALRAAVPWWRSDTGRQSAALALIGTLAAAAAAATYLLRRRARPVPAAWRRRLVAGTGVLAWGLFAVSGAVLTLAPGAQWVLGLTPVGMLSVAALTAWQWHLSRAGTGHPGPRWADALSAASCVAIYTSVATFIFLLQSGFID